MKTIGLLTCAKIPDLLPYDQQIAAMLGGDGYHVVPIVWDERPLEDLFDDLSKADNLIVRTIWGYHEQAERYLHMLAYIEEAEIPIWNTVEVLRWNMDKKYLASLPDRGIPIVPTYYIQSSDQLEEVYTDSDWEHVVIKPTISAGSKSTWRSHKDKLKEDQSRLDLLIQESDFMVQPFLPEIIHDGEYSYLFFSNGYRYAVRKQPIEGDYRVQVQFGGNYQIHQASREEWSQLSMIRDSLELDFLYVRIDGVWLGSEFHVMEVEMIEPDLYLAVHPEGIEQFAKAIMAKVE
ncbi:MAG: hypothetical protein AAFY71_09125 [Bacteroidota bacterium]